MSLFVDFTVTINSVDVSGFVIAGGTIDYGVQGTGTVFAAPTARFDMLLPESNPNPVPGTFPTLALRQPVLIHATWDGVTQSRRFTGKIVGLDFSQTRVSVSCAGNSLAYQRFPAGETNAFFPRSAEADITRVAWLADGAPTALVVEGAAARRVRQIERNSLAQPLLDALITVADDCDGFLLEDRLGVVRYRSRNFTLPARWTLPHGLVQAEDLMLSLDDGETLSTVRVFYGEPDPSNGVQRFALATDGAMASALGFDAAEEIYTDLRTPEGAQGKAIEYLSQHSGAPYLTDVPLIMSGATGAQCDDVWDLQLGWPIRVEHLPQGWPTSEVDADIVGMTEIMHQADYRVILHLGAANVREPEDDDDPIYPDGSLTGFDATGTEEIDSKSYRWCRWDCGGSGFVTNVLTDVSMYVLVCAVAGGGYGGDSTGLYGAGGGGGAGGFMLEHIDLNPGTWPVVVGAGGVSGFRTGGDTAFYGTRLYGGGRGGSPGDVDGGDGGSGGGAYGDRVGGPLAGVPGTGVTGQGHDGYQNGGGAGGAGDADGVGVSVEIAGSLKAFAAGGARDGGPGTSTGAGSGGGGGWLGGAPGVGADGVLYLRYRIG